MSRELRLGLGRLLGEGGEYCRWRRVGDGDGDGGGGNDLWGEGKSVVILIELFEGQVVCSFFAILLSVGDG